MASACRRLSALLIPGSTLWNVKLPTCSEPVHGLNVYGVISPAASAASATIGLKVEPAGYRP